VNSATDKRPAMIAQCARPDDVARCVEFGRRYDLPIAVRSGGHSFLGWGTCDDGLVIDLSSMKSISIDPGRRTVRAGAGVIGQELVSAAGRHGLAPVLGECGTVGIAGLTLGGGVGWLTGKHGAACDNLVSAHVMTTDSRSIVASATSNPDLYWAIRGGGGSFGIATSFELRLHAVREVLAGGFTYPVRDARGVLRFYRDFMAAAPDELQALAYVTPAGGGVLNVIVVYVGDFAEGERLISPLRKVASPVRDTVQRRPYPETITMPPYAEYVPSVFSAVRGTYLERLSDEAIDVALDRFAQAPPACALGFDHYMHGAVCRVAPDSTAFDLRAPGALHVWIAPQWDIPAAAASAMAWTNETWDLLQPYSGGRMYANYQSVEGESAVRAVYGRNYPRLASLKWKYDPANVLQRNQNIRPAAS
jgi:FAD/FMN-containing dehydrogenase